MDCNCIFVFDLGSAIKAGQLSGHVVDSSEKEGSTMDYIDAFLDPRRLLQLVALSLAITFMITIGYRAYTAKTDYVKKVLFAPIFFFAHMVFYYTSVLLFQEAIDLDHIIFGADLSFHHWSVSLSIHAIITVVFLAYAYLRIHRIKEETEQWKLHRSSLL